MSWRFEWDARKAAQNASKHGVAFEEAVTAFADPLARVFDDPAHSRAEPREILVGSSARDRLLPVAFSERSGSVRILSARRAIPRERRAHEEGVS